MTPPPETAGADPRLHEVLPGYVEAAERGELGRGGMAGVRLWDLEGAK
jgi:hypothetical protein